MTLDVFDGVELPDDFVTQPAAILARRGAGKTYTALRMVEELVRLHLPVVVLDPMGVCYGLRSSPDGKRAGLPVTILGGDHGDLPLEPSGGKVVANFVVAHPGAYVLDLSSFESNAAQDRFAADFAETLYRAKGRERSALHLVVDEADSFAPQRPGKSQLRMLGAFEAIVRRGRARGLGVTLVSQRPAVLNKNVLTQVEVLVALQVTAPQDRKALDDWAVGYSTPEQRAAFLEGLATLAVGEAWVWSPQWLGVFARTRVQRRVTFDSSATPKAGESKGEPRVLASVDLDVLKAEMADVVDRAERTDPRRLQARVTELEREREDRMEIVEVERTVEVPVIPEGTVEALGEIASQLETNTAMFSDALYVLRQIDQRARPVLEAAREGLRRGAEMVAAFGVPAEVAAKAREPRRERTTARPRELRAVPTVDDGYFPRAGARRMLEALAPYPAGLTAAQVATHARVKRTGGTFGTYAGELARHGLVDVEGGTKRGRFFLTPAGAELVGAESLPSDPAALRAEWRDRLKARGARAMFDLLVDAYPVWWTKPALAENAELTMEGGTFSSYLSRLRSNGLIEENDDGVRAHPDLFLGEGR